MQKLSQMFLFEEVLVPIGIATDRNKMDSFLSMHGLSSEPQQLAENRQHVSIF